MVESLMRARLAGEFVGTFMLIFTIGCNVLTDQTTWAGLSIASVLTVMIYALAGCSGAHLNPAVSVALGFAKKEEWPVIMKYIVAQLLAGLVAALAYSVYFWETIPLGPKPGFSIMQAGVVEALYTFMLCFVVLNVAASKMHAGKNQFYGIAIGFVIVAGAYGAGNISGGCFNPAVALALDASSVTSSHGYSIAYILFEIVGAALASIVFKACRPEDYSAEQSAPEPCAYPLLKRATSEFLGTYFLVLTVGLNVITKSAAPALSIAASLMCMIFALGSLSGGHFNPAVTTSLMVRGKFGANGAEAPFYMIAQCTGGLAAALSYSMITADWTLALGPQEGYDAVQAFFAELIYTFVLCFVVLSVATVDKCDAEYLPFAIGSCITVGGYAVGGISGASLNPAVSLGIAGAHLFGGGGVVYLVEYVLAEVIAGCIAALVFKLLRPSQMTLAVQKKVDEV